MSQWLQLQFDCPAHGKFDYLWDKRDGERPASIPCTQDRTRFLLGDTTCGQDSPVVTAYAIRGSVKHGEISQGKKHTDDRPPWVMNTEKLADGQDPAEWKSEEMKRITGQDPAEQRANLAGSGASYEIT